MIATSAPASSRPRARAVADDGADHALGPLAVITEKLRGLDLIGEVEPDRLLRRLARSGPGGAGLALLLGHGGVEAGRVHPAPALAQGVLGEIERKAVGVVELEGGLAGQRRALGQAGELVLQQAQAPVQRAAEAVLLELEGLADQRIGPAELGESLAHLAHQLRHEAMHQRRVDAELVGVAHGPAHDPAQHIAAPLVRGQHAVGDQEAGRTQMIGDHAVMDAPRPVRIGRGRVGGRLDQRAQQIGVVIVVLALQDRADALQPHAGIDRGLRQGFTQAALDLLILHEDEIPDLDEAVAVLVRRLPGGPPGTCAPWS